MKVTVLIAGLLALTSAAASQSYDPAAAFYDADVLRNSVTEISQMQEPELRAFARYLAECGENVSDVGKHFCAAAQNAYVIEFGNKRDLDRLIAARSILNGWMAARPTDAIEKYTKVVISLQGAARDRFRALREAKGKGG
jgi:hypothetical protein